AASPSAGFCPQLPGSASLSTLVARSARPHQQGLITSEEATGSLVHMNDLGRRKSVEERAAGSAIGAHVFGVDEFAEMHVGQLLGQADSVEGVAGGAKDGAELRGAFFEAFQVVLAVVEDHAAVGVIDAVIKVVAELAATDGLADDLSDSGGGGGDQESPRLGENLDRLGKQAVQLGIDRFGQAFEGGDGVIVVGGEAATDVEQLEIEAAHPGLGEDAGSQVQGLAVVLHVGALAADGEAQPLDLELVVVSKGDQIHGLARKGAEL